MVRLSWLSTGPGWACGLNEDSPQAHTVALVGLQVVELLEGIGKFGLAGGKALRSPEPLAIPASFLYLVLVD